MYTVLLATDQQLVLDNFLSYPRWTEMGYTAPLVFSNAADAVSALGTHSVQAVSIDLPAQQSALLYDRLHGMHMLFLEAVSDHDSLDEVLRRMSAMIERNQELQPSAAMLNTLRDTFFQSLLSGLMHSEIVLRNRLMVLDLPIKVDAHCQITTMRMINGEQYLREVWSYGRARLAMALRKFFQIEADGIYYTLSELRAGETRLLACPTREMTDAELTRLSSEHVKTQIERVYDFLYLELSVVSVNDLPGLTALLRGKP